MIEPAPPPPQRRLRLATWNVEWFNALFSAKGRLLEDDAPSARYNISRRQQLGAIGVVMTALDADGIMVIEAPNQSHRSSTVKALENFAQAAGLRCRKALIGFASGTEQEIAFLYDPDVIEARHDPRESPEVPRFDHENRPVMAPVGLAEPVRFSKPPLEIALSAHGRGLRLIGVHTKSKAAHDVKDPIEFHRIAVLNRRKLMGECRWLRARIEAHLAAGESLLVMGDLNDGPGLDEYEELDGHSGVEIVLGPVEDPKLRLFDPHADMALQRRLGLMPTTARFWMDPKKRYFEALLDYIMVSPDLAATQPDWRIWHPFNDPSVTSVPELAEAILEASDHFPVTLDLVL